jgi:hypothetical protein
VLDTEYGPAAEPEVGHPDATPDAKFRWAEVLTVLALVVAGFVTRRNVLPHDGLFGDDAWQAFGAAKGSLRDLMTVGFSGPGFTATLMLWHRLAHAPETMADLAFAAGVVTPAVLYVALRRFGLAWSISVLLGGAVASEKFNVIYSGRVKSYVIDALIVVGIVALLPRLTRVRFGWRAVGLWIAGSFVVGFFSPFALIAAGVAGVILVLEANDDRVMRSCAVAGQVALALGLSVAVRRTYNVRALQIWWKTKQDGFIGFDANPFGLVSAVVTHLRRVAAVFSGGPNWWAALVLTAAVIALAIDAFVRRRPGCVVRARYLLFLLAAAVAASVLSVLPLGPTLAGGGARLSVWLVPIFAIGAASALGHLRAALRDRQGLRVAFDVAAVVVAVLLIVRASGGGPPYPAAGSRSATQFVEKALKPDDGVFIEVTAGMYPYAIASRLDPVVQPTPRKKIAFGAEFADRRIHYLGFTGHLGERLVLTSASDAHHKADIRRAVGGASRIFFYVEDLRTIPVRGRATFAALLRGLDFRLERDVRFGHWQVMVWQRSRPRGPTRTPPASLAGMSTFGSATQQPPSGLHDNRLG